MVCSFKTKQNKTKPSQKKNKTNPEDKTAVSSEFKRNTRSRKNRESKYRKARCFVQGISLFVGIMYN